MPDMKDMLIHTEMACHMFFIRCLVGVLLEYECSMCEKS